MKKWKSIFGRLWLNPRDSSDTGSMDWNVDVGCSWVDCSLTVRDCSRSVRLNFNFDSHTTAKERAAKVDRMIIELQKFKAAMGAAYTFYKEHEGGDDD